MEIPESDILNTIVARIFRYSEVTYGNPKKGYLVRYRGELLVDASAAYRQLAEALHPYQITPLFRLENGIQTILLMKGIVQPTSGKVLVNIALFILTLFFVLLAGVMYSYDGPIPDNLLSLIWTFIRNLWIGWPFAASLMAILLAHEFGHYFVGRMHGTAVSLPYFIPFPLSFLGTMGAFIQLKEYPKNRRSLLDIGVAGPLAGLIVTISLLIFGLILSPVETIKNTTHSQTSDNEYICQDYTIIGDSYTCATDDLLEGNSILYLGLKYLAKGQLLPAPSEYIVSPPIYWLRYVMTSDPIPIGGLDVKLHPVAMAGWAGLLVTFLNLIPAGQLDGGHVFYALFGKRVNWVLPVILISMVIMGLVWNGWWLLALLIFMLGRSHAEPLDQITPLDRPRKILGGLMLIILLLILTPVPLILF